jgi:hypothetical protein
VTRAKTQIDAIERVTHGNAMLSKNPPMLALGDTYPPAGNTLVLTANA